MPAPLSSPDNAINRLLGGPLGALLLKPWYDPVALQAILRVLMPTSRAWAAANDSNGDVQAFLTSLSKPRSVGLGLIRAISETVLRRQAYLEAERAWEQAALVLAPAAELAALEHQRISAADHWMRTRAMFLGSHLLNPYAQVKFRIESEAQVELHHGIRLENPSQLFPGADEIEGMHASVSCNVDGRHLSWVRFPAAAHSGDTHGWARIEEPRDGQVQGVVVFCHGIMIEREHWLNLYDQAQVFLEPEGGALAVISPEGPGHGRRMTPGFYGGESVLARGVGGLADYFAAHVVEVGRLIAWARKTYGKPVAVAGVSLGALTAQLVVSAANHWPKESQPDAALLLTTNDSLVDVTYNGSLATGTGFTSALSQAGWTRERMERFCSLVEPAEAAMPPERIICVLGTDDTVTPYRGGQRLVQRWAIPEANVFHWPGGHFTTAFSVLRDPRPVHRFKAALTATNSGI